MTENSPLRIVVIDDHDRVREGLSAYLSLYSDFLLVGEASNWQEAEQLCIQETPQVVLLDVSLQGADLANVIKRLREIKPNITIIGLTNLGDAVLSEQALQAGAVACLTKDVSAKRLALTIRNSLLDH